MEDVVLHYKRADAGQLSSLIWRTETALETFPCRILPTFTPWFPSTGDQWLPIRPSKPAPPAHAMIQKTKEDNQTLQNAKHLTRTAASADPTSNSLPDRFAPDTRSDTHPGSNSKPDIQSLVLNGPHETNPLRKPEGNLGDSKDVSCSPNPPHYPDPPPVGQPSAPDNPSSEPARPAPGQRAPRQVGATGSGAGAAGRSWSIAANKGLPPQSAPALSQHFHKTVTKHRLHLRQRARWLIDQQNWVSSVDMEQVWRRLKRCIRSSSLPTCNANLQRDQREIWIFCDVLYSEHVGILLKEELSLPGQITLSVPNLGNILSL